MNYKHYKRLKALGFPVENFSFASKDYIKFIQYIIEAPDGPSVVDQVQVFLRFTTNDPDIKNIQNKYKEKYQSAWDALVKKIKSNGGCDEGDPTVKALTKVTQDIQKDLRAYVDKHGEGLSKRIDQDFKVGNINDKLDRLEKKLQNKVAYYREKGRDDKSDKIKTKFDRKVNKLINKRDAIKQQYGFNFSILDILKKKL